MCVTNWSFFRSHWPGDISKGYQMRDVILIRLGKMKLTATNEIKYIIQRAFLKIRIKLTFIWEITDMS